MRTNDAQMLVLSVLGDGVMHGYAINAAIERLTGRRLGAGSLYGALGRLEEKGLVEAVEGVGRRRPVRLTGAGRAVVAREAEGMVRVVGQVFETSAPGQVGYLDRAAASAAGRAYKGVVLEALEVGAGQTVVDLGCGPATDLPGLAERAEKVIGIDADPVMVARARERTAGLAGVEVREGDVHALPLENGSVDRARTDRVLQHVEEPRKVLAEVKRVLRPGGRLVMAEPDWDSLAIDYPDLEVSRGYTRHITDRVVRNGVIGRQLPRLAVEAGFDVPAVVPVTTVFRDVREADQVLGLQRKTDEAVAAGYIPAEAAPGWLEHLATGPFLASLTIYVVAAVAP